jgi:hypothetical protein
MPYVQPFKWELKSQPGAMSPARGGFRPDDTNQQILADEDIYDEYGGEFLSSFVFVRVKHTTFLLQGGVVAIDFGWCTKLCMLTSQHSA